MIPAYDQFETGASADRCIVFLLPVFLVLMDAANAACLLHISV